jgi:hypothetical protein
MNEASSDRDLRQRNDDLFDDLIDRICAGDSPWSYEEAVHIASDMWDAEEHTGPLPVDYVPKERRRRMTGGA